MPVVFHGRRSPTRLTGEDMVIDDSLQKPQVPGAVGRSPSVPADRMGACVDRFPIHTASPLFRRVGIRIINFEAC